MSRSHSTNNHTKTSHQAHQLMIMATNHTNLLLTISSKETDPSILVPVLLAISSQTSWRNSNADASTLVALWAKTKRTRRFKRDY